jgi:hypothetical protein
VENLTEMMINDHQLTAKKIAELNMNTEIVILILTKDPNMKNVWAK